MEKKTGKLSGMFSRVFRKNSFFFRMLTTIVTMICVPMLVVEMVMLLQFTENYRSSQEQHCYDVLQSGSAFFESEMEILNNAALRLGLQPEVGLPLNEQVTEYDHYAAAAAVNAYAAGIPMVEQLAVFYPGKDVVLSGGFKKDLARFCSGSFGEATGELAANFLQEAQGLSLFSTASLAEKSEACVVVAKPISIKNTRVRDALVIFVLRHDDLEAACGVTDLSGTAFGLVDGEGAFLLRGELFTDALLTSRNFQSFLTQSRETSAVCKAAGEESVLYKYSQSGTGLTFLLARQSTAVEEELQSYVQSTAALIAVSLVILALLLFATVYINYNPVKTLLLKHFDPEKARKTNELELIDTALYTREQRISTQRRLLMDFVLGDILTGQPLEEELVERYFPTGKYCCFAAAAVTAGTLPLPRLQEAVRDMEQAQGELFVTGLPQSKHTVFILAAWESVVPGKLKEQVARLLSALEVQGFAVGEGSCVTGIRELYRSYYEALEDARKQSTWAATNDLRVEISRFANAVINQEEKLSVGLLETIEKFPEYGTAEEETKRFWCDKLLDSYFTALEELGKPLERAELQQLLLFTGSRHLFSMLRQSLERVFAEEQEETEEIRRLQQALKKFVDENLFDKELCLTMVAEHLDISIYSISRMFKAATGSNFKDYISDKRLERARILLLTTSDSVGSITEAVGFDRVSYFSTLFRKKYGISPSQYRKEQNTF